ncbi:MAG: ATP-binding protein [Bacteroidales bacterium]|nr:ATP-binding protein [Bacteroidales bacterium]
MPFKIAVASGKGGTGKTTVAVNLFHLFSKEHTPKIQIIDCDVEEPNDVLFFPNAKFSSEQTATQLIPEIDNGECTFCRKCVEYCEFNAVVVIPPVKFAEVNASLCHSCGACVVACEYGAISEKPEKIGTIKHYRIGPHSIISEGRLKIGSAMQTLLIKQVKQEALMDMDVIIYDAPPGTSCPVVETVADSDYVILVTEPTPFGLYDLKLTVELLKDLRIPFGVIINKAGLGDYKVHEFLLHEHIELLGEIPFHRNYASQYAKGDIFANIPGEIETQYKSIIQKLMARSPQNEGDYHFKR